MIIIIISFIIVIRLKKSNNIYTKTSANQLFLYYKVLLVAVPLAVNIYRECKKFRVYLYLINETHNKIFMQWLKTDTGGKIVVC